MRKHTLNSTQKESFELYSHLDLMIAKFENNWYLFFPPIPILLPSTSVKNKFEDIQERLV